MANTWINFTAEHRTVTATVSMHTINLSNSIRYLMPNAPFLVDISDSSLLFLNDCLMYWSSLSQALDGSHIVRNYPTIRTRHCVVDRVNEC